MMLIYGQSQVKITEDEMVNLLLNIGDVRQYIDIQQEKLKSKMLKVLEVMINCQELFNHYKGKSQDELIEIRNELIEDRSRLDFSSGGLMKTKSIPYRRLK